MPELGQRVVQQVVGAAVQRGRGDDVVAGLGEVEDRQRLGGLAAGRPPAPRRRPPATATRCSSASCVGFMIRV